MARASGSRRRDRVDAAMAVLVRLITDESWDDLVVAAQHLRASVDDDQVLRQARARVRWALAERPGRFGERAAATLDLALSLPMPAGVTTARDGSA